jgi:excinuclease ABC subunit C
MAIANAENLLAGESGPQKENLTDLIQSVLKLRRAPRVIEGLDISNLHGDTAVGTLVSFVDGLPHRAAYRNYKIKTVNGINDYGMMAELAERRLSKGQLPDLFVVDGGKGHLSAVKRVLDRQTDPERPEVVSIAKPDGNRREESDKIYIPGRKNPLGIRPDHPVLLFMMQIRDEAHRRAIMYHRRLRRKKLTGSELDLVPGIGAKRKKRLLEHFRDINAIADAGPDELARIPGIDRILAQNVHLFFRSKGPKRDAGRAG